MADPTQEQKDLKIEAQNKQFANLANSEDWKEAKRVLAKKMLSEASLLDMPESARRDPIQTEGRYLAARLIAEWIGEIDGSELPRENAEVDPDSLRGLLRLG